MRQAVIVSILRCVYCKYFCARLDSFVFSVNNYDNNIIISCYAFFATGRLLLHVVLCSCDYDV